MAEYIEKAAILSKCEEMWNNADETTQTGVDTINAIDRITDFIEAMPIANVQPVKRGKWKEIEDFDGDSHYGCSACGAEFYLEAGTPSDNEYYYCPHCGAKMSTE